MARKGNRVIILIATILLILIIVSLQTLSIGNAFLIISSNQASNSSTNYKISIFIKNLPPDIRAGVAQAILLLPGTGIYEASAPFSAGKIPRAVELKLDVPASAVNHSYAHLEKIRKSYHYVPLPTLKIIIFSANDGGPCIASISYSTVDYIIHKGAASNRVEAAMKALEDPMSLIKASSIEIDASSSKCISIEIPVDYRKMVRPKGPSLESLSAANSLEEITVLSATTCSVFRSSNVVHPGLYETLDDPPETFMEKVIVNVYNPDEVKRELWAKFVEKMAYAYYVPTTCNEDEAIATVAEYIGLSPGLHTMKSLLSVLSLYTYGYVLDGLDWVDEYPTQSIGTIEYYPTLVLRAIYPYDLSREGLDANVIASQVWVKYMTEKIGITFLGIELASEEVIAEDVKIVQVSVELDSITQESPLRVFYTINASVYYISDLMLIIYDIELDDTGEYYIITPMFLYMPGYLYYLDYTSWSVHGDDALNPQSPLTEALLNTWAELTSLYGESDIYTIPPVDWIEINSKLIPAGTTLYGIVLEDTNVECETEFDLGELVTLLFNTYTITSFAGMKKIFDSDLRKLSNILSLAVGVTLSTFSYSAQFITITADAEQPSRDVFLTLKALSMPYWANSYTYCAGIPIAFAYNLYVDASDPSEGLPILNDNEG